MGMEHAIIPIDLLDGHVRNYRSHPPEQIQHLKASLERFQQIRSIVVRGQGNGRYTILAGHGVVAAARECGIADMRCDVVDDTFTDDDANAYLIADNYIQHGATDDEALLAELIQEQYGAGYTLAALGTDEESLRQMLSSLGKEEASIGHRDDMEDEVDVNPDEIEVRCKPGELWALGQHRLLVGDCTISANMRRLFDGRRAALVMTSPPYANARAYHIGDFDWDALMRGAFDQIILQVEEDAHILINLGLKHRNRQVDPYWNNWLAYCGRVGWPLFGWYVWDQGSGLPGNWDGRLAPSHEFLFHFNRKQNQANKWLETKEESRNDKRNYDRSRHMTALRNPDGSVPAVHSRDKYGQLYRIPDSVIRVNRECARGIHTENHPAVFPIAFPEFIIKTWSQEGDIVYEPFAGSGTTILAAERQERRCLACEIDVKYASVILARFTIETGMEPVLIGNM